MNKIFVTISITGIGLFLYVVLYFINSNHDRARGKYLADGQLVPDNSVFCIDGSTFKMTTFQFEDYYVAKNVSKALFSPLVYLDKKARPKFWEVETICHEIDFLTFSSPGDA